MSFVLFLNNGPLRSTQNSRGVMITTGKIVELKFHMKHLRSCNGVSTEMASLLCYLVFN